MKRWIILMLGFFSLMATGFAVDGGAGSSGGDGLSMGRKLEQLLCNEDKTGPQICVLGNLQTQTYYLSFDHKILEARLEAELFTNWQGLHAVEIQDRNGVPVTIKHQLALRQADAHGDSFDAVWTYDKVDQNGQWVDYQTSLFKMTRHANSSTADRR